MDGLGAMGIFGTIGDFIKDDMNRKDLMNMAQENRNFDLSMHRLKRSEALADWERNNDYNDPKQQMARLKKAGLNPNLAYGAGTIANTSQPVRATQSSTNNQQAPRRDFSFSTSLQNMIQMQAAKQQVDNLALQNELLNKTIEGKSIENERTRFDLDFNKSVQGYRQEKERLDIEGRRQSIGLEQANYWLNAQKTQFDLDRLNMEKELQQGKVTLQNYSAKKMYQEFLHEELKKAKTIEETNLIKQAINNAKWDSKLKSAEYSLAKYGLGKSDVPYLKLVAANTALSKDAFHELMIAAGLVQIGSTLTKAVPSFKPVKKPEQMSNGYPVQKFNPKFYDK